MSKSVSGLQQYYGVQFVEADHGAIDGTFQFHVLADLSSHPLTQALDDRAVPEAGLYIIHDQGVALYVGESGKISERLYRRAHSTASMIESKYPGALVGLILFPWWLVDDGADFTHKIKCALRAFEARAIWFYRPVYNAVIRRQMSWELTRHGIHR
jgi:hypothetical protein